MDLSIFLFRLFGFYLLIVGVAYLVRPNFFIEAIEEFFKSRALALYAAVINLILGLLLTLNYNEWELSAKGFVTLMGYLILLKGVSRLFFPDWGLDFWKAMSRGKGLVYTGVISIVLGCWLLLEGFF